MLRASAVLSVVVLVNVVALGCSGMVMLTDARYVSQFDTVEVQVIDARDMTRAQVEHVLDEHDMIGRFDARVPDGDDFERDLAAAVEKGRRRVLQAGGNVLLYTDDSELIAIIAHDARYAGAPDAITMYALLRRGGR